MLVIRRGSASLLISKSTKYLNNIKRCNEYIHLPNGKNVLSTIQSVKI